MKTYVVVVRYADTSVNTYVAQADSENEAKALIEANEGEPDAKVHVTGEVRFEKDYAYLGGKLRADRPWHCYYTVD